MTKNNDAWEDEVNASEWLENQEEMLHQYYMHSDLCSTLKTLITYCGEIWVYWDLEANVYQTNLSLGFSSVTAVLQNY